MDVTKCRNYGRTGGRATSPGEAPTGRRRGSARPAAPSVRDAWLAMLEPYFASDAPIYFTGTYRDEYGFSRGLMLVRNVHADFARFLRDWHLPENYVVGVEAHQYRDILHLHALVGGSFTDYDRAMLKAAWESDRGFARVLPVTDGGLSYVTKYALKGDCESFDWRLA